MLSISCHSSEVLRFKAQVRLDTSGPKHVAASSRIFALQRLNAVHVSPSRPSFAPKCGRAPWPQIFEGQDQRNPEGSINVCAALLARWNWPAISGAATHCTRATFGVQSFLQATPGTQGTWALSRWMQAMQSRGLLLSGRCQHAGVARITPFAAPRMDLRLCTPSLRRLSTRRDVAQRVAVTEAPTEQPQPQLQG